MLKNLWRRFWLVPVFLGALVALVALIVFVLTPRAYEPASTRPQVRSDTTYCQFPLQGVYPRDIAFPGMDAQGLPRVWYMHVTLTAVFVDGEVVQVPPRTVMRITAASDTTHLPQEGDPAARRRQTRRGEPVAREENRTAGNYAVPFSFSSVRNPAYPRNVPITVTQNIIGYTGTCGVPLRNRDSVGTMTKP